MTTIKQQKQEEFQNLRFGMFIHFGIYSLGKEHEWHMHKHKMKHETYKNAFMHNFNPDPKGIEDWVLTAKNMGAKYIVCTSKHHDGFCLWDTKIEHKLHPDYHLRNTPFFRENKRSVLDYLFDAGKKHGIRIGLYYSVIDWSWTDNEKKWRMPQPHLNYKNLELHREYVDYYKKQVLELAKIYPDLLLLWFDGYQFKHPKFLHGFLDYLEYDDLYKKMQEFRPEVLVGNNSGKTTGSAEMGITDFLLFENGAGRGERSGAPWPRNNVLPGEVCLTINRAWGYAEKDKDYKNPEEIQQLVIGNTFKNANTLLNFGPMPHGYIAPDQKDIAESIGKLLSPYIGIYDSRNQCSEKWGFVAKSINSETYYVYIIDPRPQITINTFTTKPKSWNWLGSENQQVLWNEQTGLEIINPIKNTVLKISM